MGNTLSKNLLAPFLLMLPLLSMAQLPFQEWTNLARTSLATASVSGVNGNRSALNHYYGAANLFDGGQNVYNNINYDYWLSEAGPGPHWVQLDFLEGVDVYALKIKLSENLKPQSFSMKIIAEGWVQNNGEAIGPFTLSEHSAYYAFPEVLQDLKQIRLTFEATEGVSITEIEVLGKTQAEFREVERPYVADDGKYRPEANPPPAGIDKIINAYFNAVSGSGKHSWKALRAICEPDIQFLVVGINENGENRYHPMPLKQFEKHMGSYIKKYGFFQSDQSRQINHYQLIATAWSDFESRNAPEGEVIDQGTISFQLIQVKGQWKIGSVMWNSKPGG